MVDLSRNALARKRLAEQWDDDPTGQKAADREALNAAYDKPTIAGKILSVIPGFDTANALSRSKQPAAGAAAAAGRDAEYMKAGDNLLNNYINGDRARTSWTDALLSTMWTPYRIAQGMIDAAELPGRAYNGELGDWSDPASRDRYIAEGLNFAGNMAMGGSVVPKPSNAAGMFGGRLGAENLAKKGETRPLSAIERAERMQAEGASREAIHAETSKMLEGTPYAGVHFTRDGKPRFEIDDSGSFLATSQPGYNGPLRDLLIHKTLYEAYPSIGAVQTRTNTSSRHAGQHTENGMEIAARDEQSMRGTTLHEAQHNLQGREGFAPGGNLATDYIIHSGKMKSDFEPRIEASQQRIYQLIDEKYKATQDAMDKYRERRWSPFGRRGSIEDAIDHATRPFDIAIANEQQRVTDLNNRYRHAIEAAGKRGLLEALGTYNNLAGEVEARTVQKRADLTPDERRARPPWLDYDIPESQQIVRLDANGKQSALPGTIISEAGNNAPSPQGIRAYHGSPHDFDKFDASKIGTGEGAQAFGHGLYFAENEGVAKSYREGLSKWNPQIDGKPLIELAANGELQGLLSSKLGLSRADGIGAARLAAQALREGRTVGDIVAEKVSRAHEIYPPDIASKEAAQLESLGQRLSSIMPDTHKGKMYEVSINANPEDFLDWDKPLSQQSEKVGKAFSDAGVTDTTNYPVSQGVVKERLQNPNSLLSKTLKEQGIPGIRYLDQGSRAAGEGSRNYVVFDPAIISILRKYGLAGMLGGAAMAASGSQPADAAPSSNALSRRQ